MGIHLSVVIPAYNEARRLPPYLHAIRNYLSRTMATDGYEVIIVDDGSRDELSEIIVRLRDSWPELELLVSRTNCGKGAAVRKGILAARGDRVLFADADGATPIEEEHRLRAAIDQGADLAIGSRSVDAPGIVRDRFWQREVTGRVFSGLVGCLVGLSVQDTQCGFKMFRREVARRLFQSCTEDGFLFDVYILAMAERLGYRIDEVAINWREVAGSKVRLARDSVRMVRGLFRIRAAVGTAVMEFCPSGVSPSSGSDRSPRHSTAESGAGPT